MVQKAIASYMVIDNGVVGEPEVDCGVAGIAVDVVTLHPFQGRLYIQVLEF